MLLKTHRWRVGARAVAPYSVLPSVTTLVAVVNALVGDGLKGMSSWLCSGETDSCYYCHSFILITLSKCMSQNYIGTLESCAI